MLCIRSPGLIYYLLQVCTFILCVSYKYRCPKREPTLHPLVTPILLSVSEFGFYTLYI